MCFRLPVIPINGGSRMRRVILKLVWRMKLEWGSGSSWDMCLEGCSVSPLIYCCPKSEQGQGWGHIHRACGRSGKADSSLLGALCCFLKVEDSSDPALEAQKVLGGIISSCSHLPVLLKGQPIILKFAVIWYTVFSNKTQRKMWWKVYM